MDSDPEEEGQGRTACIPGQGCGGAGQSCGADEVYGRYAGAVRDGVANCADYVDRLIGQLQGRPSRHYVAEKAQLLRNAVGSLAGACHDVEIWLRYCGAPVPFGDSGFTDECVLPAGHFPGEHCAHPPRSTFEEARDLAGKVAEASVAISDHLGWMAHDPGRLWDPYEVEDLARSYRELRRRVEALSPAVAAVRAEGLTCLECEFQAGSIGQLEGHKQEAGH